MFANRSRLLLVMGVVVLAVVAVWLLRPPPSQDPSGATAGAPGTVLLIPGHGGNTGSLSVLADAFGKAGWDTQVVSIGSGDQDISGYGQQVASLAGSAAASGKPVVLVGYSMGGLIARAAVASGAAGDVSRVVTVGTPHAGTKIAGIGAAFNAAACDFSCRQMAPGSDFLEALPVAGDETRWLTVYTENDDVVLPVESGALEGASVVRLQDVCAGANVNHGGLVQHPYTVAAAVKFATTGEVLRECVQPQNSETS